MPVGRAGRRSVLRLCPQIRDKSEKDTQSCQADSRTNKPIAAPSRDRFHLPISPFRSCLANSSPAILARHPRKISAFAHPTCVPQLAARDVSGHSRPSILGHRSQAIRSAPCNWPRLLRLHRPPASSPKIIPNHVRRYLYFTSAPKGVKEKGRSTLSLID